MPDKDLHNNSIIADLQSKKIRYGAPDGPRKKLRENYDGHQPLEYPGHEAVAHYLASPKSLREFDSDRHLAKHFRVSRMTICRWKHDRDVIQRAHFLSEINQMVGDLLARQEWPRIMQMAVQNALGGDLQSIRFCESRAFPKQLQVPQPHFEVTVSTQDVLGPSEIDDAEEMPDKDLQKEGDKQ